MTYKLFHVDDCMYVAAADEAAARAYVQEDCGSDCADSIEEAPLSMRVTTANVDDGEQATPETMTTAGALIEDHLKQGGTLPFTVCFDGGMNPMTYQANQSEDVSLKTARECGAFRFAHRVSTDPPSYTRFTDAELADFVKRIAALPPQAKAEPAVDKARELPDAIRVPLDELEADARYLAARLANGTMAPSVGAEAVQRRTRAIREALMIAASPVAKAEPAGVSEREAFTDDELADLIPQTAGVLEIEGERKKVCMTRAELHQFIRAILSAAPSTGGRQQ